MRSTLIFSLLLALCLSAGAEGSKVRLLVQSSPLAGSQYYAVGQFWGELKVGDALTLVREADNRHDRNAIRVEWRGHRLGYVPRRENRAAAAAMDAGEPLLARISRLTEHPDPWRRVEIEIFLLL